MLSASGKVGETVIKVLAGATKDPSPNVRVAALKSLAQVNSPTPSK